MVGNPIQCFYSFTGLSTILNDRRGLNVDRNFIARQLLKPLVFAAIFT